MDLTTLQQSLHYTFKNQETLMRALTHSSFGHEFNLQDNERLEFLGDAILDAVVSHLLLEAFPNANEGQLSKMRASVVKEKALAQIAKSIGLQDFVRLGKGERLAEGNQKPSILANTFEAVIAAVCLDGGYKALYPVVRHLFVPLFHLGSVCDHKTQLQELVQAHWQVTPVYHLLRETGPDHDKTFTVHVLIKGASVAIGTGSSLKGAEQDAAKAALELAKG